VPDDFAAAEFDEDPVPALEPSGHEDAASRPAPTPLASLPPEVRALTARPASPAPELTLIVSEHDATKSYVLENGKPKKLSEPGLSSASVHRAHVVSLTALNAALQTLPRNVVLTCGAVTTAGDNLELTTKNKLPGKPGAITRTKGWAAYTAGKQGLFVIDYDAKDLPPELLARVEAAGGIEGVLASVCPEFGRAGILARPSVSTGIRCKSTGATTPGGSMHLYVTAKDGGDIKDFIRRIHERLILAGWGWVFVTKAGKALTRSLVDASASGDPERLVYEADGVLEDPDLELVPGARGGLVSRDGALLDTRALPELSPSERQQLAATEKALWAAKAPEIAQVQARVKQERAERLISSGVLPAEAQSRAAKSIDNERLDSATVIPLDDGRTPTVADILRDPYDYAGATCADPLEPDYGGGRNKAIICVEQRRVTCRSQAHGKQNFTLAWTARDLIAAWEARRDPNEIAAMYPRVQIEDPDADQAAIAAAGVPTWAGLEFGLDALGRVPDLVKQNDIGKLAGLKASLRGMFEDRLRAAGGVDAVSVLTAIAAVPRPAAGTGWAGSIDFGRDGLPKPNLTNAALGLGEGCGLCRHLWFDAATRTLVVRGVLRGSTDWDVLGLEGVLPLCIDPTTFLPVFPWTDALLTNARRSLEPWGLRISKEAGRDTVAMIAARNTFSSVAGYLRSLSWDGIPRLGGWLVRHAGAHDTAFNAIVLAKWMISAVARALFPEEHGGDPAKVDTILTLAGPQEGNKSTFLRLLCALPLWHTENGLGDLTNKDAVLRIISAWIVDMSEGGSLKANEVETLKQFVTVLADSVRLPYAAEVTRHVRRCVFAITVNPDGTGFLRDGTGNRRFWVVNVEVIDIARLKLERDQLWAEAVARFDANEKWWFDKSDPRDAVLAAEAAEAAESHRSRTPVEEDLRRYLIEAPKLDGRGRVTWTPRPQPLSVLGPLPDILAEMGFDARNTIVCRDAARALRVSTMRWRPHRVRLNGAVVDRDTSIWVDPAGGKALDKDERSKDDHNKARGTALRGWLAAEAAAGRIDPLALAKPVAPNHGEPKSTVADFTDVTLTAAP
jgi:Virulence-associated protein E